MSEYIYDPIPKDAYIRYLSLNPGNGDEPFAGNLIVKHIDELPEFDAISYVWGNPQKVARVICDGKSIGITANLRDALRRARHPDSPRNLWADQICIDQKNLEERGHQVKLMGKIYSRSSTTLLWLGDAPRSEVGEIQSLVADINDTVQPELLKVNGDWPEMPVWSRKDPIFSDERWGSFAKMTRCDWFARVWIVQEAGLSKDPLILYGDGKFKWERWIVVMQLLWFRASSVAMDWSIRARAVHLFRADIWKGAGSQRTNKYQDEAGSIHQSLEWSLPEILHHTRFQEATDPKDRVYAFLGHPSAFHTVSNEPILTPDYTAQTSKVYYELAVQWIAWTEDLNILSFVQHESETALDKEFPSWVPLWDTRSPLNSIYLKIQHECNAGMQLRATSQVLDGTSLQLHGVIFDTLEYTTEIFSEEDFQWRNGVAPESKTIHKWKDVLSHIGLCSAEALNGNDYLVLDVALEPFYCSAVSGYASSSEAHIAAFILSRVTLSKIEISPDLFQVLQEKSKGGDLHLVENDCYISEGRRFAITQRTSYALVPPLARKGDLCCIIFGAGTPFIIRPVPGSTEHYRLVGEAFVNRVMKGEIVKRFVKGEFEEQKIVLV